MDNLEIDLPSKTELIIRVPDKRLYSYDFTSFSLLQKMASQRMKKHIKNSLIYIFFQISLIKKYSNQKEEDSFFTCVREKSVTKKNQIIYAVFERGTYE